MLKLNEKERGKIYQERKAGYVIVENSIGQIGVVEMHGWGLIFLGGKVEEDENSEEAIRREILEEIGYEVNDLKYYDTIDCCYEIIVKNELINCHSIADFYTGIINSKIQEPIEKNISLKWFYPNELFGKMKLEFQNIILNKLYTEE